MSPERRPAKKVTWGGMDVAAVDAVGIVPAALEEDKEGRLNRLFHPPKTSR